MQEEISGTEGVASGKLPLSVNIPIAVCSCFIFFGFSPVWRCSLSYNKGVKPVSSLTHFSPKRRRWPEIHSVKHWKTAISGVICAGQTNCCFGVLA